MCDHIHIHFMAYSRGMYGEHTSVTTFYIRMAFCLSLSSLCNTNAGWNLVVAYFCYQDSEVSMPSWYTMTLTSYKCIGEDLGLAFLHGSRFSWLLFFELSFCVYDVITNGLYRICVLTTAKHAGLVCVSPLHALLVQPSLYSIWWWWENNAVLSEFSHCQAAARRQVTAGGL